jgi:hypothetical protein
MEDHNSISGIESGEETTGSAKMLLDGSSKRVHNRFVFVVVCSWTKVERFM